VSGINEEDSRWRICSSQKLSHAQCLEFSIPANKISSRPGGIDGFIVNWKGRFFAYQNSCPHTGVSLNWMPNQLLDLESRYLQCGLHGALFEPDTGLCVHGPCVAQSLLQLPLITHNDGLYLALDKFIQ